MEPSFFQIGKKLGFSLSQCGGNGICRSSGCIIMYKISLHLKGTMKELMNVINCLWKVKCTCIL